MACQVERNEDGAIVNVKAPNGADSLLFKSLLQHHSGNAEQALRAYAMTHTSSFKEWFGDWVNSPETSSKVVDANGEPLVVYHGSNENIEEFDEGRLISGKGVGFYFSPDIRYSKEFLERSNTIPVYLSLKNPDIGDYGADFLTTQDKVGMVAEGKDGVIAKSAVTGDEDINEYVAFKSTQIKSVDNKGTFAEKHENIFLMPDVRSQDVPKGGNTKLVHLKNNLLHSAKKRLSETIAAKNKAKADKQTFDALAKEQKRLEEYISGNESKKIEGLENEIDRLSKINSKSPDLIAPFIEKELSRLDTLLNGNTEDVKEARDIIEFIEAVADIRVAHQDAHPFFEREELYNDEGEFMLDEKVEDIYREWGQIATAAEGKRVERSKVLQTEIINANDNIQKFYDKPLTYNDIVLMGKGLKDTHWVDMMIMDVGTGIFSHNGIIPQVAKMVINEEFEKEESWSKEVADKIDHILPKVRKILMDIGHDTRRFLTIKGASYDLFRQKDKFGNYKPGIASKYSFEWQDGLEDMQRDYKDQTDNARGEDTKAEIEKGYKKAAKNRDAWLKKRAKIMNPALIPEIVNDPEFSEFVAAFGTEEDQQGHAAELKKLVGEKHYNKIVEEQKQKLREYIVQRRHEVEEYIAIEGKTSEADLSNESKFNIQVFDYQNNPFAGAIYSDSGNPLTIGNTVKINNSYRYNIHVPLKEVDGQDSGFYDENYAEIEKNDTLMEFYEIISDATTGIWDRLDHEAQQKVNTTSILGMERTMLDLFLDKDIRFYQAISESCRRMIDALKLTWGVQRQNAFSHAKINAITGLPEYKINDDFIQKNIARIQSLFQVKSSLFRTEYNLKARSPLDRFTKFTVVKVHNDITKQPEQWLMELVSRYSGTPVDQVMKNYAEEQEDSQGNKYTIIRVGKIIQAAVMHDVAMEMSFDLPKVIKNYANLAAQYSARKNSLPTMELMKEHYLKIKAQVTQNSNDGIRNVKDGNNNRLTEIREHARRQYENWFERAVLGNYGLRKNIGFVNKARQDEEDEKTGTLGEKSKINNFMQKINKSKDRWDGKLLSKSDKEMERDIDKALELERDEKEAIEAALAVAIRPADKAQAQAKLAGINKRIDELENIKSKLGKDFALSGVFDTIMTVIRWKGLGFNIPSGIKNVIEGQVSNSIIAARGQYFPTEYINEITLTEMSYADSLGLANKHLMPQNAALMKVFMSDYNMLQDASNELQKSSEQGRFKGLSRFNPFYILKKGEYYNQTPIVAAVLKDTSIKGVDANGNEIVSNVKDAMVAIYDKQGKRWVKQLRPEFRSPENIASWEKANGRDYFNFKSRMRNVISNIHGDFDPLTGMMAKSTHTGQAATMFKTWLPRMIYQRIGMEQDNLIAGVKGEKGMYQSHTPMTAMVQGGLVGLVAFGPPGWAVGSAAGFIAGKIWGVSSSLNWCQELLMINKLLFRKMIGIPLDPLSRMLSKSGKNFMQDNKWVTPSRAAEFKKMQNGAEFDAIDYGNFKANMQEIALMCAFFACLLITKAVLWDDDDEEDSWRRKMHNWLANEFMGLSSSASTYITPKGLLHTVTDLAVIRFIDDCTKALGTLQGLLEGTDKNTDGPNKFKSKAGVQWRKTFLPGIAQPDYGFGRQSEKQFVPSPYDHYFWGEEKKAEKELKLLKVLKEEELMGIYPDMEEDKLKKKLNKSFGRRKKGESFEHFRDRKKAQKEREEAKKEAEE